LVFNERQQQMPGYHAMGAPGSERPATAQYVDVIAMLLRPGHACSLVEIHQQTGSIGATSPRLIHHTPSPRHFTTI